MADDDGENRVSLRLTGERLDWTDATADLLGVSRSELIRDGIDQLMQLQDESQERKVSLIAEEQAQIEENQQLKKLLPSKWRSHVRDLFRKDLKDDVKPADLKIMAKRYREQAETKEELAAEIDDAPDADLVGIVDEELQAALEAADLSNWYDDVENPHEKALGGVEDGRKDREIVAGYVETLVRKQYDILEQVNQPFPIKGSYLPETVEMELPDGVTRDDVAQVAVELVDRDVRPEDLPEAIPTTDPRLEPDEIESEEHSDDVDDGPQVVPASEATQDQLANLPAADGGRSDGSPFKSDEDTDMEPDNDTDDTESIEFDRPENVEARMDQLMDAEPVQEGEGDE